MTTYTIDWTTTGETNGKPAIVLPPYTKDLSSTSLTLTGKGTASYGEIQQENFIRLLENFASANPPENATVGQIWFNTSDDCIYVLDTDSEWKRIGGIFKGPIAPTSAEVGDLWYDTTNVKLSIKANNTWNQVWPSLSVVPIAYVDEYNSMVNIYNKVAGQPNGTDLNGGGGLINDVTYDSTTLTYDANSPYEPAESASLIAAYDSAQILFDSPSILFDSSTIPSGSNNGSETINLNYSNSSVSYSQPAVKYSQAVIVGEDESGTGLDAVNYGYGQAMLPFATVDNMTNDKWVDLLFKFEKLALHQGTTMTGLSKRGFILDKSTTFGIASCLDDYKATLPVITSIKNNHHKSNLMSMPRQVLPNSTYTRTASYFNGKVHELAFTFNDATHACAFFNSGGKLSIGMQFTPSQSTLFTESWKSFLGTTGNIMLGAGTTTFGSTVIPKGFYSLKLGGVYTDIAKVVSATIGSEGAYVNIQARLESIPNSTAIVLRLNIIYTPAGVTVVNPANTSANCSAIGSTVSTVTTIKASDLYLNNPPIAFPTVTQGGSFITDSSL